MRSEQDELEACMLGAVLINNQNAKVFWSLPIEAFRNEAHRWVAMAMRLLLASGTPLDLVSLKDELVAMDVIDMIGGPAFVAALTDGVPRAGDGVWYARQLMVKHGIGLIEDEARRRGRESALSVLKEYQ